ncbi:FixH family protein [Amycolatopsis sp. lyj-112]|uniref:FixH family protein n=1 Tax=Amycolatopsis sp. lyj-112 TaxID=2789288 RepID=UPI0039791AD1
MTSTPSTVDTERRRPVLLISVGAVLVAAMLAWLLWPSGDGGAQVQRSTQGPYTVELSVTDPHQGGNAFALTVTGAAPDVVTVEPVMPQMGHALAPSPAIAEAPGRYRTGDVLLPMAGQWEITVSLRGPSGAAQHVFPLLVK